MKNYYQYAIVIALIIIAIVFGFVLMKEKPDNIYTDQPTPTVTPRHQITVPTPTACYNQDGVEVECKG